jgi:hypothetical protein
MRHSPTKVVSVELLWGSSIPTLSSYKGHPKAPEVNIGQVEKQYFCPHQAVIRWYHASPKGTVLEEADETQKQIRSRIL